MNRYGRSRRPRPRLMWLWGLLLVLLPVQQLRAVSCSQGAPQTVSLPDVSIPSGTAVGALLGTPVSATMVFSCTYGFLEVGTANIQAGGALAALDASNNPAGPGITFATNLPGIALRVTGSPTQASSQVCTQCGPNGAAGFQLGAVANPSFLLGGTGRLNETFTLQLIKTGNVVPGSLTGVVLIPFWWSVPGFASSSILSASLVLGGGTTVTVPACTVNAPADFTVALPTVSTRALAAVGATAGRTGFHISLNCPAGITVAVSMQSSRPNATVTGLSEPMTGGAAQVGVQLLGADFMPVNVAGLPQAGVRTSAQGLLLLTYYAQYYLLAGSAGAGRVNATVTYTLTYP